MSLGFSSNPLITDFEATRAGFGHRFAGAGPLAKDPVPPYWITAKSNCPDFSLEFLIKLPDEARAIRLATGSEVFGAVKEFVEKISRTTSVTSARGEDARMKKMEWTFEATTDDGRPQFPEFQRAIAKHRLRERDKHSGVKPPTGGRVTVRDVICIQNLRVWWQYAAARREMKEEFAKVGLGTNSVRYAVTSEPGLDGMRHLPTIDPAIGETIALPLCRRQRHREHHPGRVPRTLRRQLRQRRGGTPLRHARPGIVFLQ